MIQQTRNQETIAAHFVSRDNADDARERLVEEGVPDDAIRVYPDVAVEGCSRGASAYDVVRDEGGFWASLAQIVMPDRDRRAHAEGMSRGGATVTVTVAPENMEQVATILERHGAVDIEDLQARWRQDGWTGHDAEETSGPAPGAPAGGGRVRSYGAGNR